MIKATVCLYSGRPNPEWEFKAALYNQLLLLFDKCTPLSGMQHQPAILGYSGSMIIEKNKTWYAWNNVLSINYKGKIIYYTDTERYIEKLVIASAPSNVKEILRTLEPGLF